MGTLLFVVVSGLLAAYVADSRELYRVYPWPWFRKLLSGYQQSVQQSGRWRQLSASSLQSFARGCLLFLTRHYLFAMFFILPTNPLNHAMLVCCAVNVMLGQATWHTH